MPIGRIPLPLALFAAAVLTAGRAVSQSGPPPRLAPETPEVSGAASCPSDSPHARRVRVVIPPPEVVFRYQKKHGWNLFHHGESPAEPCSPEPPCAAPAAPAGNGMVSFNMNMTIPYMMNAGGMYSGQLGGAGLSPGMFGMPGGTGFGSGLGGFAGGLGNPALAAALGLPSGASGNSTLLDLQQLLQRAQAARAAGTASESAGGASQTPPSPGLEELQTRLNKVEQSMKAMNKLPDTLEIVKELKGRVVELEKTMKRDQSSEP